METMRDPEAERARREAEVHARSKNGERRCAPRVLQAVRCGRGGAVACSAGRLLFRYEARHEYAYGFHHVAADDTPLKAYRYRVVAPSSLSSMFTYALFTSLRRSWLTPYAASAMSAAILRH